MSITPYRTAIVTGAARGIGAAIARRLAQDGLALALFDLDDKSCQPLADELARTGAPALAVAVDVADEGSVAAGVDLAARELGPPAVLVNNAGVIRDNLLFKMSADDWDTVMDIHLRGAFLMSRAAQRYMTEARWGRIINISSTSALGNRGQVNYAAAKAGIQGFTKTLAIELGKFGVTANAIAPGFINTEMSRATARRIRVDYEDLVADAARQIPVGRVGEPEDVAHLAVFLASEGAAFISGQVIYAAGGPCD